MRILVGTVDMDRNRFFRDLNTELARKTQLNRSSDDFWEMRGEYDVVHLHYPEYLTPTLQQACEGRILTDDLMAEAERRFKFWADRARVVITRHNLLPHRARNDLAWERMYEAFHRYADGVVHFARASLDEFRQRYRRTAFYRGHEPFHVVIPHHNYASLPNDLSGAEARKRLGISSRRAVMLIFGDVRNGAERQLILDTFRRMKVRRKLLLVSRWREKLAKVSWIRLKYWIRDLTRLYYRLHPGYHFGYRFVDEADAQLYLNAADVLFIPRFRVLNSGNVTTGMTFGRVVVGPDSWDVGEVLRETGNPVFDPDHPETAVAAIEEGFRLAREGRIGPANRERALRNWGADRCAAQYVRFFEEVLGRKK